MTAPVFFSPGPGLTLREIIALTGAELRDNEGSAGALNRRITGIGALDRAGPKDLTFFDNADYADDLTLSAAGACMTSARFEQRIPPHLLALRVREPYRAFVQIARALFPEALRPSSLFDASGVTPGAFVHPTARLESGATIDPGAVVGAGAEIGTGTVISACAVIGPRVRIGRQCSIGANVTLTHAIIGDRVIIHPGCHIGQDGFGFVMGAKGHAKVPQIGRVIIQNDVEIGAGSTIDRGANRDTVIGEGTKIDNLVQVGHNASIGRHCVVVAQSGISGSATIEDYVVLGARVGVNNHVRVGEGAQIGATSAVKDNVPPGARWGGVPAKPAKQWFREVIALERLAARSLDGPPDPGRTKDKPDE
jgi:UDP-3-O-[3-hydroxymyristoyl] glucosamine N-acyltransferase